MSSVPETALFLPPTSAFVRLLPSFLMIPCLAVSRGVEEGRGGKEGYNSASSHQHWHPVIASGLETLLPLGDEPFMKYSSACLLHAQSSHAK